jgi:hypothetical protein
VIDYVSKLDITCDRVQGYDYAIVRHHAEEKLGGPVTIVEHERDLCTLFKTETIEFNTQIIHRDLEPGEAKLT